MCVNVDMTINLHGSLLTLLVTFGNYEVHVCMHVEAHDHLVKGLGKANGLKIEA